MKITRLSAFLAALLCSVFAPLATAQIAPVGPFTGANSESFESIPSIGQVPCHPMHILAGTAELCGTNGGIVWVGGTSHCSCAMHPIGQHQALAGNGGHARIRFTTPAIRFGGYFGLNCNVPNGRADFYDPSGVLIGSMPLTVPAD